MHTISSDFQWHTPKDLQHALKLLGADPTRMPFAGGTDLMVLLESGTLRQGAFVDINQLAELKKITFTADQIEIGALVTYGQIISHPKLTAHLPQLVEAARQTAAPAIQNRGTIGGNIANGSPAADTPPALLIYEPDIHLISATGRRALPYGSFHTGYKRMERQPQELIEKLVFKPFSGWTHQIYEKVGTRKMQAISKVVMAAAAQLKDGKINDLRIAMGAVAPIPKRLLHTEALCRGQVASTLNLKDLYQAITQDISPISDIRSTDAYRLRVASNLVASFLHSI